MHIARALLGRPPASVPRLRTLIKRETPINPSTLGNPAKWLKEWALGTFGGDTHAGFPVNTENAMGLVTVFACIRIISESLGQVPLQVFERKGPRTKEKAIDHDYYYLLHDEPNPDMTSITLRETMQAHVLSHGNGVLENVRNNAGRTIRLEVIPPSEYEIVGGRFAEPGGSVRYRLHGAGTARPLRSEEVIHIPGLGFDGVRGYSPIAIARNAIALGLVAEKFGAEWFAGGGSPTGAFEYQGELDDAQYERLKKDLKRGYPRVEGSGIMLLEGGAKWHQIGIPPEQAQFILTRKMQMHEIARLYRVFPHLLGDMESQSYNSVEQLSLEFVRYTLMVWFTKWEQELNRKLFVTDSERKRFRVRFNLEGLLRADLKTRAEAHNLFRNMGVRSVNDILEIEDENSIGPEGDTRLQPLNMGILGEEFDDDEPATPTDDAPDNEPDAEADRKRRRKEIRARRSIAARRRLRGPTRRLIEDATARIIAREGSAIRRVLARLEDVNDPIDLRKWLRDFYRDFPDKIARVAVPILAAYMEAIQASAVDEVGGTVGMTSDLERAVEEYSASWGRRHSSRSNRELQAIVASNSREEAAGEIRATLDGWAEKRPKQTGQREVVRAGNAFVRFAYIALGVMALRWVATGENCPLCQSQDGRVIGTREVFLQQGDIIDPKDDKTSPFLVGSAISHPPLHEGCDCDIVSN